MFNTTLSCVLAALFALVVVAAVPTDVRPETAPEASGAPGGATDSPGTPRAGPVTRLPMPRFVSLRSSEINVRRGPGLAYRKDWVFRRRGMPVRVVDEYGDWRRIVDQDGAGGWVYHSLLSGRRTVIVTAEVAVLRDRPVETAVPVAKAEQGVVASLRDCAERFCLVEIDRMTGWVLRDQIWGAEDEGA